MLGGRACEQFTENQISEGVIIERFWCQRSTSGIFLKDTSVELVEILVQKSKMSPEEHFPRAKAPPAKRVRHAI